MGNNITNQTLTGSTKAPFEYMGEFEWQFRKLIGDKLDKYTSWAEFISEIDTEVAPVENAVFNSMKEKFNKLAA